MQIVWPYRTASSNKTLSQYRISMFYRLMIAVLIGIVVAAALEAINGLCAFLLPPLIFISPLCLVTSLIIAVTTSRDRRI
jgi:hypothetical protein